MLSASRASGFLRRAIEPALFVLTVEKEISEEYS